jgi:hypothetical protein
MRRWFLSYHSPDQASLAERLKAAHCHKASTSRKSMTKSAANASPPVNCALKLGGLPDMREPLPPRSKWKHKKRYQRLRNQAQVLEAQASRHFRKQIDIRTFAYHIA